MPRSANLATYSAVDRAIVSDEFFAKVTTARSIHTPPFTDEKAAKRFYFQVLAILRAAKATGAPNEQVNAHNLGIRMPTLTSSGWTVEIYDKTNPHTASDPLGAFILATLNNSIPAAPAVSPAIMWDNADLLREARENLSNTPDSHVSAIAALGYSPKNAPNVQATSAASKRDQTQGGVSDGGENINPLDAPDPFA